MPQNKDFHALRLPTCERWEVVLDDENVWSCDGTPEIFDSEEAAYNALNEFFADCEEAVQLGYMDSVDYDAPYYVRKVETK